MQADDHQYLRDLIFGSRQAALGTLDAGAPFVSMVLYATMAQPGLPPGFLIHVSRLAAHTRQMLDDPRASLLIMRPDTGVDDPQALPRITLQAVARPIPTDDPAHPAARATYLARLPQQEYLFAFPDFQLFRLEARSARYVGGFARAFSLDVRQLAAVVANTA